MKEQKTMLEVEAHLNSESLMSELTEVEEVIDRIISKVDILKATLSGIEPLTEGGIFIPENERK